MKTNLWNWTWVKLSSLSTSWQVYVMLSMAATGGGLPLGGERTCLFPSFSADQTEAACADIWWDLIISLFVIQAVWHEARPLLTCGYHMRNISCENKKKYGYSMAGCQYPRGKLVLWQMLPLHASEDILGVTVITSIKVYLAIYACPTRAFKIDVELRTIVENCLWSFIYAKTEREKEIWSTMHWIVIGCKGLENIRMPKLDAFVKYDS